MDRKILIVAVRSVLPTGIKVDLKIPETITPFVNSCYHYIIRNTIQEKIAGKCYWMALMTRSPCLMPFRAIRRSASSSNCRAFPRRAIISRQLS